MDEVLAHLTMLLERPEPLTAVAKLTHEEAQKLKEIMGVE
jgi:hypothetical protein